MGRKMTKTKRIHGQKGFPGQRPDRSRLEQQKKELKRREDKLAAKHRQPIPEAHTRVDQDLLDRIMAPRISLSHGFDRKTNSVRTHGRKISHRRSGMTRRSVIVTLAALGIGAAVTTAYLTRGGPSGPPPTPRLEMLHETAPPGPTLWRDPAFFEEMWEVDTTSRPERLRIPKKGMSAVPDSKIEDQEFPPGSRISSTTAKRLKLPPGTIVRGEGKIRVDEEATLYDHTATGDILPREVSGKEVELGPIDGIRLNEWQWVTLPNKPVVVNLPLDNGATGTLNAGDTLNFGAESKDQGVELGTGGKFKILTPKDTAAPGGAATTSTIDTTAATNYSKFLQDTMKSQASAGAAPARAIEATVGGVPVPAAHAGDVTNTHAAAGSVAVPDTTTGHGMFVEAPDTAVKFNVPAGAVVHKMDGEVEIPNDTVIQGAGEYQKRGGVRLIIKRADGSEETSDAPGPLPLEDGDSATTLCPIKIKVPDTGARLRLPETAGAEMTLGGDDRYYMPPDTAGTDCPIPAPAAGEDVTTVTPPTDDTLTPPVPPGQLFKSDDDRTKTYLGPIRALRIPSQGCTISPEFEVGLTVPKGAMLVKNTDGDLELKKGAMMGGVGKVKPKGTATKLDYEPGSDTPTAYTVENRPNTLSGGDVLQLDTDCKVEVSDVEGDEKGVTVKMPSTTTVTVKRGDYVHLPPELAGKGIPLPKDPAGGDSKYEVRTPKAAPATAVGGAGAATTVAAGTLIDTIQDGSYTASFGEQTFKITLHPATGKYILTSNYAKENGKMKGVFDPATKTAEVLWWQESTAAKDDFSDFERVPDKKGWGRIKFSEDGSKFTITWHPELYIRRGGVSGLNVEDDGTIIKTASDGTKQPFEPKDLQGTRKFEDWTGTK